MNIITKQYKKIHLALWGLFVWVAPVLLYAQCAEGKLCNPLANEMGLWGLIEYIVRDIVVAIVAPVSIVLALLWSGFMFIQAQGNEAKLAQARTNFLYVVIGSILLLGAYVILTVLVNTIEQLLRT